MCWQPSVHSRRVHSGLARPGIFLLPEDDSQLSRLETRRLIVPSAVQPNGSAGRGNSLNNVAVSVSVSFAKSDEFSKSDIQPDSQIGHFEPFFLLQCCRCRLSTDGSQSNAACKKISFRKQAAPQPRGTVPSSLAPSEQGAWARQGRQPVS